LLVPIECATTFAIWYTRAGNHDRAWDMLQSVLPQPCSHADISSIPEANARRVRARVLSLRGDAANAEVEQRSVIEYLQKLVAAQDLPSLSSLSSARIVTKELVRARGEIAAIRNGALDPSATSKDIEMQRMVVEDAIREFGDNSLETRMQRSRLGTMYRNTGMLEKTLGCDEMNLKSWKKSPVGGPRYKLEGRRLKQDLATTLCDLGRYGDARALEAEVMREVLKLHGEQAHPETATALYRLAKTCFKEGAELEKAAAWVTRAIEIHQKFGCEQHESSEANRLKASLSMLVFS
jgi:tetratricopeptide (TPR) repeat protein